MTATETAAAPRAFNREMYHDQRHNVFYGTDDGAQDGSFREFGQFVGHYEGVDPARTRDIHMVSVVGGLYGLNLIPLWKPTRLTIFDINPAATAYFEVVRRVWLQSRDVAELLQHFTDLDYETDGELQRFVAENIQMKQKGCLDRSRGSTKRPYEQSWQYAFEHFDVTKRIFAEVPTEVRTDPMESPDFAAMVYKERNLWVYGSNVTEFHWFDLDFEDTSNVVLSQIIFPGHPQILDLATLGGTPVRAHFRIPLAAEKLES